MVWGNEVVYGGNPALSMASIFNLYFRGGAFYDWTNSAKNGKIEEKKYQLILKEFYVWT